MAVANAVLEKDRQVRPSSQTKQNKTIMNSFGFSSKQEDEKAGLLEPEGDFLQIQDGNFAVAPNLNHRKVRLLIVGSERPSSSSEKGLIHVLIIVLLALAQSQVSCSHFQMCFLMRETTRACST